MLNRTLQHPLSSYIYVLFRSQTSVCNGRQDRCLSLHNITLAIKIGTIDVPTPALGQHLLIMLTRPDIPVI